MKYNIYCDESCHLEHDNQKYMVLGGIICEKSSRKCIKRDILNIKRKYNVSYDKMCMIGDQFLTDIYGSNKLGLTSCLIDKISDVEGKYTKFKRKIEKRIIKSLYKKYNFERGKYYD